MGKVVIVEEKADKMVDKLEMVKECIEDMIYCFTESMEGYRHNEEDDDDDWDDEYEVKRRRGSRRGYRRGMRGGGRTSGGMSRF